MAFRRLEIYTHSLPTEHDFFSERSIGSESAERSDIFAFGVLLYELLAGVHPFTRSSQSGTLSAILHESPVPIGHYASEAPESARVMLERLLAKEPRHRYQSFVEVRSDLRQLVQDVAVLTALPQTAVAAESVGARRTPFVGREAERTELRQLLDGAIAGRGAVLLLGGEPGVGKTRLAEELLAEARHRGCLALTGRCYETEGAPPFIPWVELVLSRRGWEGGGGLISTIIGPGGSRDFANVLSRRAVARLCLE